MRLDADFAAHLERYIIHIGRVLSLSLRILFRFATWLRISTRFLALTASGRSRREFQVDYSSREFR